MQGHSSFDPVFQTTLPLPLARLYARAHHAKGDRERHDHAFHLLEASLKLAASALTAAYRASLERSEKVDAALQSLALPSLGQWRDIFRETLGFLGKKASPDPWARRSLDSLTSPKEGEGLVEIFAALAKASAYRGRASARVTALDLLDLLPAYRNAMSDAHGAVKADPKAYREATPALLHLAHLILEDGAILGGGRLVYAEEVKVGLDGERRVVWMDLTGATAMRRQPYEGERSEEEIRPERLYLETSPGAHLALHPLIHYQPGEVLDQVFYLNRARGGKGGVQFLSYDTGEFYLPGRDPVGDYLVRELEGLLSWVTSTRIDTSAREALAGRSQSEAAAQGEALAAEEAEPAGALFGDFEILGELGRGGMAVVYQARQRSLGRIVALKVLPPMLRDNPVAHARFKQEVQALSRCDHPNVVKILSSGQAEGTFYYAMEFIDGGDLAAIGETLKRYRSSSAEPLSENDFDRAASSSTSLPERERAAGLPEAEPVEKEPIEGLKGGRDISFRLAAVMRDAARGMQHIHDHGIIHRDLKPQNIMVTRDEHRPVIMDLGLAKLSEMSRSLTVDKGSILGTLRYMPPEQLQRNLLEIDPRADVYALGAVLYELACLRPMYDGDTEERLTTQILFEEPPPPQKVHPRLPTDLATIIAKATQKDRRERYGSAAELSEDLDRFIHGEAISARPPTLGYLLSLFIRRHRAAVAAASLAFLAFILLIAGWMVSLRSSWQSERAAREMEKEARRAAEEALAQKTIALTRAEGLRLASDVYRVIPESPGLALLLGLEAHRLWPGLEANNATLSALEKIRERLMLYLPRAQSAEFSPDGQNVVTGSSDGVARIWDATSGKELVKLSGHGGPMRSATFSPDGHKIVTASWDGTARIWDATSGKEIGTLRVHCAVQYADFSPDGQKIVTALDDSTAWIWDATSGRELATLKGHEARLISARFSPDGKKIITASHDTTARIWDAKSGKELATLKGHKGLLSSARFSPDGQKILTNSNDETARIWDASTFKETLLLTGGGGMILSADFSPDGQRVVTSSWDGKARIWDATSGKEMATLRGHVEPINCARYSLDGQRVVTASEDLTVRIWDVSDGKEGNVLRGHEDVVLCVNCRPDGQRIVTAASEDGTARIWDASTLKEITTLKGHESWVYSASFSPDAKSVLTASLDATARIWDAASGKEIAALKGHKAEVHSASFSPDGRKVVTASDDGTARIWDALSGKEIAVLKGHESLLRCASYSPDGQRILTASDDRTARIWDASTLKEIATLSGHEAAVNSARFSPDGQRIVTASSDWTAKIWDASTFKEIITLRGHTSDLKFALYSPDGQKIVTASNDRTARIWDATSGKELTTLRGHTSAVNFAVFTPDGQKVLTASSDATVRIWPADPLKAALQQKYRDLSPDERDQFEIGSKEERNAYRDGWDLRRLQTDLELTARAYLADRGRQAVRLQYFQSLQALVDALVADTTVQDLDEALRAAQEGVKTTRREDPNILGLLASVQALKKDYRQAILTLEEALELQDAPAELATRLEEYGKASGGEHLSYASIDSLLLDRVELIPAGAVWRFFRGKKDPSPGLEWTQTDFDDGSWEKGPSGFGYADGDDATILEDMMGFYTTVYIRHVFEVPDPNAFCSLALKILVDDGCVAYLDGTEVGRVRTLGSGAPLTFDAVASAVAPEPLQPVEIPIDSKILKAGKNVLAVQGLNATKNSSDLSLIPVLTGESIPDKDRTRKRMEELVSAIKGEWARPRIAYIEGRLLALAGKHREAAPKFAEAASLDWEHPEPLIRLAASLEALGDLAGAKSKVREALCGKLARSRKVWDLWARLVLGGLKKSAGEALAMMPQGATDGAPRAGAANPRDDLLWVLKELQAGQTLRLNAGGEEYRSPSGAVWSADRLYLGGYRFGETLSYVIQSPEEIAGTEDDALYQTERSFSDPRRAGYRVPLPEGRYRVVLHFAEIFENQPGQRIFDVLLEETPILENYEPLKAGFATAETKAFETRVTDGFLDIRFVARQGSPKISAIEIEFLGNL